MKVLITGASGLVGKALALDLLKSGIDVYALARSPQSISFLSPAKVFLWDHRNVPSQQALSGYHAVVHLAGENIAAGRWTEERKAQITSSRIEGTRNLVLGLSQLAAEERPRVLISASAIGIYGDAGDDGLTEASPSGTDFLARLCQNWEARANAAVGRQMRVVNLRTGVVLAQDGGALDKMGPVTLGSGKQWVSWIHLADMIAFIRFAMENASIQGPFNLVSPQSVRQKDFAKTLAAVRGFPLTLPAPALAIRMLLGEMAQIVLASQRVLPQRALAAGFEFRFPDLRSALEDLFRNRSSLDQTYSVEQFVEAPRGKVVPFFSKAENLEELTPPWLNFKILKKSSDEIANGSIIEYRLNIHGVPVKWKTRISDWNLPASFTDDQLAGPYRKWHHVHSFHEVPGGTLLTDHVTYRVPLSWIGKLVLSRFIARDVRTIFNFRKQKINEIYGRAT